MKLNIFIITILFLSSCSGIDSKNKNNLSGPAEEEYSDSLEYEEADIDYSVDFQEDEEEEEESSLK